MMCLARASRVELVCGNQRHHRANKSLMWFGLKSGAIMDESKETSRRLASLPPHAPAASGCIFLTLWHFAADASATGLFLLVLRCPPAVPGVLLPHSACTAVACRNTPIMYRLAICSCGLWSVGDLSSQHLRRWTWHQPDFWCHFLTMLMKAKTKQN